MANIQVALINRAPGGRGTFSLTDDMMGAEWWSDDDDMVSKLSDVIREVEAAENISCSADSRRDRIEWTGCRQ